MKKVIDVKLIHPKIEVKNGQIKPTTAIAKPNVAKPAPSVKKS